MAPVGVLVAASTTRVEHAYFVMLGVVLLSCCSAALQGAALPMAYDVRVEAVAVMTNHPSPIRVFVGARRPRFSWSLRHPMRGGSQHAYRIKVSMPGNVSGVATVWDSGVVVSNETILIPCGVDLVGETIYDVAVQWMDKNGSSSPAASGLFATTLLEEEDWEGAKWFTLPNQTDPRNQFRTSVALPLDASVAQAFCHIAGLGYHRSWINGALLANEDDTLGIFAQFQRRTPYDTYDVTQLLEPGNNTLAVLLGHGWYALQDDNKFVPVLGYKTVGVRSLRVICSVTLNDGKHLQFTSGQGQWPWRYGAGELVSDNLFLGETIDKRLETIGWQRNGYDDSSWTIASEAIMPTPAPAPVPPASLHCPSGQRLDTVESDGDNGSCDCDLYCASDWSSTIRAARPNWIGAAVGFNYTRDDALVCVCVQGSHWCPRNHSEMCGAVCNGVGKPVPTNYCVPDNTPTPPPTTPAGQEYVPLGKMTTYVIPKIKRHEPRSPVSVKPSPSGTFVLDFGVNQAAQCTLRVDSDGTQAGTTLRLHHAEQIADDGSIIISNDLGGVEDETTFIMGASVGIQTFDTRFSYFGSRFVEIAGWPNDSAPDTGSMVCYFVHTALPKLSSIEFTAQHNSDTADILNGIHDITMRSALSNFMSTPTDCPSREKRGWTGDGQAAAETLIYSFDMSAAYPKWLGDIADAQQCNFHVIRDCPEDQPWCRSTTDGANVPEIAPFLFGGQVDSCSGGSDPAWGSGYIALIDWVYRYYSDLKVLQQHYGGGAAYLDSLLDYVDTTVNGSYLLDLSYPTTRYGDWCAPLPLSDSTHGASARHTSNLINGFYWIKQLRIMANAAQVLGKSDDATKWNNIAAKAASSYNALYFDQESGKYKDNECLSLPQSTRSSCHNKSVDGELSVQTAQALPLFLSLPVNVAEEERVGYALAYDVMNGTYPGRTTSGLVGSKYVLSALVNTGHGDVALKIATAMEFPSWGRMLPPSVHPLGQGEGTLWEQFGGSEHQGFGSRNHIMLGGFDGPYFYGNLAGIQNVGLAWNKILISPTISGDLTGVSASVWTVRGSIEVMWDIGDECAVGIEQDDVSRSPAIINCSKYGSTIANITFANYGRVNGTCGNWTPVCSANDAIAIVSKSCVGKPFCSINASGSVFGSDPCPGQAKTLNIVAVCKSFFRMSVTIPVGSVATVRLPIGSRNVNTVVVIESTKTIWSDGKYSSGAEGILAAAPHVTLAGVAIDINVGSGKYSFSVLDS